MADPVSHARLGVVYEPPIARITLKHPPLNVIDLPMMEELSAALDEIQAQPEIFGIVICGAGKAFSAGVDVAAHTPDTIEQMLAKFHRAIRAVIASKKVTIAAVHGACLGGGAELAMVCDIVYTTDDAQWGFPEIKLGCYPPVACAALAGLVGQKRATELILTGRSIGGREAADIGLATAAMGQDKLKSAVDECIRRLQTLSRAALAIAKSALYTWDAAHVDKGLTRAEKIYLEDLMKTCDAQEGIQAFMEKRPPKWVGK